jgi:hypothetical protein
MPWGWSRLPPVMERTFRDDVKWALAVLAGAALAYLMFGHGDASVLLGCLLGAVGVICVLTVARRVKQRRKT